jgi:hypothetical protein
MGCCPFSYNKVHFLLSSFKHLVLSNPYLVAPPWRLLKRSAVMTHKYSGCIIVLSINKTVKPNEEHKVLTSSFDQGFTVNTSKWVSRVFDNADK